MVLVSEESRHFGEMAVPGSSHGDTSLANEIFPFDFLIWVGDGTGAFECSVEVETVGLEKQESGLLILE